MLVLVQVYGLIPLLLYMPQDGYWVVNSSLENLVIPSDPQLPVDDGYHFKAELNIRIA